MQSGTFEETEVGFSPSVGNTEIWFGWADLVRFTRDMLKVKQLFC